MLLQLLENMLYAKGCKPIHLYRVQRVQGIDACIMPESHKARDGGGYWYLTRNNKNIAACRLIYQLFWGLDYIPDGLTVSHICEKRNDKTSRLCVNPYHLILESLRDNMLRSPNTGRYKRKKHPLNYSYSCAMITRKRVTKSSARYTRLTHRFGLARL